MPQYSNSVKIYHDLQRSRFKPSAFTEWTNYRDSITDLIIHNCEQKETLAIWGAGHCDDIDLKKLAPHFSSITLIDINKEALSSAIHKYSLSDDPNIHILVKDFVGISDDDYTKCISIMLNEYTNGDFSSNKLSQTLFNELNQIYEKARCHNFDWDNIGFDNSVAIGIHSQLNDTADWILSHMCSLLDMENNINDIVYDLIHRETEHVVRKFNDVLIAKTNKKLIVGYELGINDNINGIQGAVQNHHDLREREYNGSIKSVNRYNMTWPYNKTQNFVFPMMINVLERL